jgi:predicted dehydrogenase
VARQLRAGVVGAGVFGGHHARQYAALDGVELVGVFDPDMDRAATLASTLDVRAFDDLVQLLMGLDVLTVASPAATHREVGVAALNAGVHVYVEKPLAATLRDADTLVSLAAAKGLVLACGHQERMVSKAMGLLDIPERPVFLEAIRRQPGPSRITDVSCVLDLMIHDIDLALTLNPSDPLAVEAEGGFEEARAEVTLDDGATLKLEASRIADARERRMRIVFPSGEVEIDFVTRAFRNTTPFALDAEFTATPAGSNPLRASVAAFVAAVRAEAPRPAVTGEEAARALDLALAVEQAAGF